MPGLDELTLREAATRIGTTPDALRRAVHDGRLRATKRGRDWFVAVDELERYDRDVPAGQKARRQKGRAPDARES